MGINHFQIDERSLALHRAVARQIRKNPALLEVARKNLERWIQDGGMRSYWSEWKIILYSPLDEILSFLISNDERAKRLRQSSPFCGILTPQERWKIYESFTA
jgi:hypothetical protein